MPRFYFDIQDSDGLIIDDEGVELDDPATTGEIAVQVRDDVGKIMRFRVAIEMEIDRKY